MRMMRGHLFDTPRLSSCRSASYDAGGCAGHICILLGNGQEVNIRTGVLTRSVLTRSVLTRSVLTRSVLTRSVLTRPHKVKPAGTPG